MHWLTLNAMITITILLTNRNRVKNLHELGKHSKMYLEIGSAMGSTAVSVLDTGIVTCIDNWKQNINPKMMHLIY